MRYLLFLFVLLAAAPAAAAPQPDTVGAQDIRVECLKLPSNVDDDCVPAPGMTDFPKLCLDGYGLASVAACTKVIESGPSDVRVWAYYFRAMGYGYAHRLDEAISDYGAVLAEKPDMVQALAGRGLSYAMARKFDLARADLERALALNPESFQTATALSYLESASGDVDRARSVAHFALKRTPKTANGYYARGLFYLRQLSRDDPAEADFTRAIELQPDHEGALLTRSEIYARTGRMELALRDCSTAVKLKLPGEAAHFCFGMAYFTSRQYPRALREFRAVLADRPDKDFVWVNCASMELLTGRYAEALADLDRALAVNPGEVGTWLNRGVAHRHLDQPDLALADYAKALELDPKNATIYVNRGALYLAQKDYDRAAADFEQALLLKPDDASARRGLDWARRRVDAPVGMKPAVVH